MKRFFGTTMCVLTLCAFPLHAQQPPAPNAPLELPEFLVTGKELIDVGAGVKHTPRRPPMLSAGRLDTLNPAEKIPAPTLPYSPLPQYSRSTKRWPGYVDASVGNYITPALAAGYSFVVDGYRLDLAGDVAASQGWVDNAGYVTGGAQILSTYVAPEKFIFFGGSTTQADVAFRSRSYTLFADSLAPSRSHTAMRAGIAVDGEYDGTHYTASASWQHQNMNTENGRAVADDVLRGTVRVEQQWPGADVGAKIDVNMQTFAGNGYPFVETGAYGGWVSDVARISAGLGVQWATSTENVDRFGVSLYGRADVFLGGNLTLLGSVQSGMRTVTFRDLVMANPYVSDSIVLDAPYDIADVRATLSFHPSVRTTINVTAGLRQSDREPVWKGAGSGIFHVTYQSVRVAEIGADARFALSALDLIGADVRLISATVIDNADQPYVPGMRASAEYERVFTPQLRSTVGLVYNGRRYADLANTMSLPGYADVRLKVAYSVSASVDLIAKAENLLSSTVYVWEGYRERGLFVNIACLWRF